MLIKVIGLLGLGFLLLSCHRELIMMEGHYQNISRRSETFDSRVQYVIIHYTAVDDDESFRLLLAPYWPASSHYLITTNPSIHRRRPVVYQLVDESMRAWHAGRSRWRNDENVNAASIGIEIVNLGFRMVPEEIQRLLASMDVEDLDQLAQISKLLSTFEDETQLITDLSDILPVADTPINPLMSMPSLIAQTLIPAWGNSYLLELGQSWFPYNEAQFQALVPLLRDIQEEHQLHPTQILAHADISPNRKSDPGPLFWWQRLHEEENLGAWFEQERMIHYLADRDPFVSVDPQILLDALRLYGYAVPNAFDERIPADLITEREREVYNEAVRNVIRAFQMHFRPLRFDGVPDAQSEAIALALVERYRGGVSAVENLLNNIT